MQKPWGDPFVGFRLPPPMLAAAKAYAAQNGLSLSGLIRNAVSDLLEKEGVDWHTFSEPIPGQTTFDDLTNA